MHIDIYIYIYTHICIYTHLYTSTVIVINVWYVLGLVVYLLCLFGLLCVLVDLLMCLCLYVFVVYVFYAVYVVRLRTGLLEGAASGAREVPVSTAGRTDLDVWNVHCVEVYTPNLP